MHPFIKKSVFRVEIQKCIGGIRMKTINPSGGCCSPSTNCCSETEVSSRRELVIDFLYLDLDTCDRCQDTDSSLDEALQDVSNVLKATGVNVQVNKVNVITEAQAQTLQFLSSPTIRINGQDIQLDVHESQCEACGDLCGDSVDCRVWIYDGKEFSSPPKALIVEAILKHVYGVTPPVASPALYVMPENLKNFYAAHHMKNRGQ